MAGRRNRSEWKGMSTSELTRLMANRVARIEVLKIEVEELRKMISEKMRLG